MTHSSRFPWIGYFCSALVLLGLAMPAAAAAQAAPEVSPTPTATPTPMVAQERRLELLYTGMTGGLSSGQVDFAELYPLFQPEVAKDFEAGGFVQDNVFHHGDFYLYTSQGPLTLEDFSAFFKAGPFEIRRGGPMPVIASDYALVLQPEAKQTPWLLQWLNQAMTTSGKYPDARSAEGTRFEVMNHSGLTLSLLSLNGQAPSLELLESPSRWEMLPAGSVTAKRQKQSTQVLAVGRPLGDGLRRASLLNRLRAAAAGRSLTVDLGNLLDPGHSELSRQQREFTFLQLSQLGYDVMVPAETELSLSKTDWERLSRLVPMVAANLKPNQPSMPPLPPYMIKEVDGLKVALVGLVDDRVLTREGAAGPNTAWLATDPVAAARTAVAQAEKERPDAIFLLSNVRDERLQQFRQITGYTAILADFQGLPGEVFTETANLSGVSRLRSATAYMLAHSSRSRLGRLTATFEAPPERRPVLKQLANDALLVTDRLPYEEGWRWQLNLTLDRYQTPRRQLLLPDLRDALSAMPDFKRPERDSALPRVEGYLWSRLVSNVLREATGAEVAITRLLPMRTLSVGPINQLMLDGWLEVGDRLVQTTLSGKALKALAATDASDKLLTFSGYDPVNQKVYGYSVVDDELYRVTTTDQVVRHARFQDTFAKRPLSERWLRNSDGRALPYAEGERTEMREVVLAYLKALKSSHGGAFDASYMQDYRRLLASSDQCIAPRWTILLDDGQLLLNSYQNQNRAAFGEVRNTRVVTPNSFSLGGKGKLAVVYDSKDLAWENRAKAIYKRTTLTKDGVEVTQETDDEVTLTSEFRLKFIQIPLAGQSYPLLPFVNSNYTTEFTPGEVNGTPKPRRAELNAIGGLVLYPGWGLKELRAGAVVKNDLANPGALEPGFQAIGIYEQQLTESWPALVRAGFDVTHYMKTPYDTPDRLGLLADFTAGLTIPLWDRFNCTISADYFLFRGKVPANDVLGTSLDFKVGLGYSLGFKPFYGVWF